MNPDTHMFLSSASLALGMIEFGTTPSGLAATDQVLKTAACRLLRGSTVCPGKFFLLFGGELAPIRAAYDTVQREFAGRMQDAFFLGNAAPDLLRALAGSPRASCYGNDAVGVIETFRAASAVAAADAALKAAEVDLLELRLAQGMTGKGLVYLAGTVAAVQVGVATGAQVAKDNGTLCASGCLAAPHEAVWRLFGHG